MNDQRMSDATAAAVAATAVLAKAGGEPDLGPGSKELVRELLDVDARGGGLRPCRRGLEGRRGPVARRTTASEEAGVARFPSLRSTAATRNGSPPLTSDGKMRSA